MASEKRYPSSEQTADAVYQRLVAVGKVPPYVPFRRIFCDVERKEKQDIPLPQGVARVVGLTRYGEFQSDHHLVIIWMYSEEFDYEGGERQTQIWHVNKVRLHTFSDDKRVDFELIHDVELSIWHDDNGCVMYGHAPKK